MKTASTLFFTSLAATGALFAAGATPAQKPNIIFILTDDLGYGDLGSFYQNMRRDSGDRSLPWHATPQLDRMAAEGARLTHHYCSAPVSVASRASLLSGLHQGHANVRDNQFDKALADNHTVGTVLQRAGYATAAIGKWGLHGANKGPDWPAHPLKRGFDFFYGFLRHVEGHEHYPKEQIYFTEEKKSRGTLTLWENRADVTTGLDKCYTTDLFTARAKQWIIDHKNKTPETPFFIYLAYDTPHAVLELPTQAYPKGGGLSGGIQWLGTPGRMINTASGEPDSWMHPDYENATYTLNGKQTPWPDVNKRYAASVRRIDDAVGDLLQTLRDLDIDQNTIVIFTSDNGPSQESYLPEDYTPDFFSSFGPFDGIKRDTWEGGLRVPAIVRWPGNIPAGSTTATPCAMYDWLPTFADLAGLPAPANADGISLRPGLTGLGVPASREYLYFEYLNKSRTPGYAAFEASRRGRLRAQMQAIRLGDLMAVRYDIKNAQDDFEIYNVVTDPKEAHNLAKDVKYTDLQSRFKALALQSRRPEGDTPRPYDKTPVPALAQPPARTAPGLAWTYYEGNFPWVPDCAALGAKEKGVALGLDLTPLRGKQNAALCFKGYLNVPDDGNYTFALTSDGGAVVRLHEATLFDADRDYKPGTEKTAQIYLKAGLHPLMLTCRAAITGKSDPVLTLKWNSADGSELRPIPDSAFSCEPSGKP